MTKRKRKLVKLTSLVLLLSLVATGCQTQFNSEKDRAEKEKSQTTVTQNQDSETSGQDLADQIKYDPANFENPKILKDLNFETDRASISIASMAITKDPDAGLALSIKANYERNDKDLPNPPDTLENIYKDWNKNIKVVYNLEQKELTCLNPNAHKIIPSQEKSSQVNYKYAIDNPVDTVQVIRLRPSDNKIIEVFTIQKDGMALHEVYDPDQSTLTMINRNAIELVN